MRTGILSIGGVAYNYTGNNSGEISQSITGLDDEVLRTMPRTHYGAKGEPYVAIDGGVEIKFFDRLKAIEQLIALDEVIRGNTSNDEFIRAFEQAVTEGGEQGDE